MGLPREASRLRINFKRLLSRCELLSSQFLIEDTKKKKLSQFIEVLGEWKEEMEEIIITQEDRLKIDEERKEEDKKEDNKELSEYKDIYLIYTRKLNALRDILAEKNSLRRFNTKIEDRRRASMLERTRQSKMRSELLGLEKEEEKEEEEDICNTKVNSSEEEEEEEEEKEKSDEKGIYQKTDEEYRKEIADMLENDPERRRSVMRNRFRKELLGEDTYEIPSTTTGLSAATMQHMVEEERNKHKNITSEILELTGALKNNSLRMDSIIKRDIQELGKIDELASTNLDDVTRESDAIARMRASSSGSFCCVLIVLLFVGVIFIWMVMLMKFSPI